MNGRHARAALGLVLASGLAAPAAADGRMDVALCVNNTIPAPLPPGCNAVDGDWSFKEGLLGSSDQLVTCGHFNGVGYSVELEFHLFDGDGSSLSIVNENIPDWENLDGSCEVPDPNPCELTCENLYNARNGPWQFTGGTGAWDDIQGGGYMVTFVNRMYDVGGTCTTNAQCAPNLCDTAQGVCFRREGHAYFSGRAHFLKGP
jgi:hypothetical protein